MTGHVLVIKAARVDPGGRTLGAWELEVPSRPTPRAWRALTLAAALAAMAAAPFVMERATRPEAGKKRDAGRPGPSAFYRQDAAGIP